MPAMIESRWATGTYEMLLETGNEWIEGDVGITIFATALTLDPADEKDAPILAQVDTEAWAMGMDEDAVKRLPTGLREIGEHGIKPEELAQTYGAGLALRILRALYEAAGSDMRGVDIEDRPWRQPSPAAGALRERVLDVMVQLTSPSAGL